MRIKIPYGKKFLGFNLPGSELIGILENRPPRRGSIKEMLGLALDYPLNADRLEAVVSGKEKALIVVPDSTRSAHLKEVLPGIVKRIKSAGCANDIIIATGLHRKHDRRKARVLLGARVADACNAISHEQSRSALISLGSTAAGVPITLNRILKEYDAVITVGVIEPHLYAGYSGGAKTISIGLAGEETINATHGIRFLDDTKVTVGEVADNPFQEALWEIISRVSVDFAVNIVNDSQGGAVKIFAGNIESVFREGVNFAKKVFEVEAKDRADIVICGIGYPKDINLYQASRALNYVSGVDKPVLKKGGVLIVAAELRGGFGDSRAEGRFYNELKAMRSPRKFMAAVRKNGCVAGEHRAYMVARALSGYNIIFVTKGRKPFMKGLPFPFFEDVESALGHAEHIMPKSPKIYIIPHALATIAKFSA